MPTSCAIDAKPSAQAINYNPNSNRAMVYLVEAGLDKIPVEQTLGGESAVLSPLDPNADHGHISRNFQLIFNFFYLMNPFIEYQKPFFDDKSGEAVMPFRVVGCIEPEHSGLSSPDFKLIKITRESRISAQFYELRAEPRVVKKTHSLRLEFSCDQKFREATNGVQP